VTRIIPILPLLLFSFLLWGCGDQAPQLRNGEPAPAFTLERLEGGSLQFPDALKGRVTAIRFWADWCPFCEGEMRLLEPVYRKYRDQGLTILAVNVRQERETVERFIAKLGISYDTLLDESGEVARTYGVAALPTTFLVDGRGVLRSRILGESTPEIFEQAFTGLLTAPGK